MTKKKKANIAGVEAPPLETLKKGGMEKLASGAYKNNQQTALDLFHSRKKISKEQFESGQRLQCDFYLAFKTGYAQKDIGGVGGGFDAFDFNETTVAARQRYRDAMLGVGVVLAGVLSSLVLGQEKLADYGRRFGYKHSHSISAAAITSLKLALDSLIIHYSSNKRLTHGHVNCIISAESSYCARP